MVQSGTTGGAPSKARARHSEHHPGCGWRKAVIIAHAGEHSAIANTDTDCRDWRQSSGRMDYAPPMCAPLHSTPDASRPISRFSGGRPERPEAEAWKEKSWESLRVRLQSSRAEAAGLDWPQPSASWKKVRTW